jgi:hypothetical protein
MNGTLQCDVKQQINNVKSDISDNYIAYSESSRTIVDLSSGEITLYKKNDAQNISTVPTKFINININDDISNNSDISKNIMLVNDNSTLKISIPTNIPTIVKVDISGQVINTTTQPIKITTKDPCIVETFMERFTLDNIEGFTVTPVFENYINGTKDSLPTINIPVFTKY